MIAAALLHYTDEPLTVVRDVPQRAHDESDIDILTASTFEKPHGLWVSVGRSWPKYRKAAERPVGRNVYEIALARSAHLLRLTTLQQMRQFSRDYRRRSAALFGYEAVCIDWAAVAAAYDGILIAPLQEAARFDFDTSWYYCWDCASACIWNAAAVSSVTQIRHRTRNA